MADSGLEDLLRLVYPGDVTHIMDGESYYKALSPEGPLLIDCALCCYLFEDKIAEEDLENMASYISKCSNEKLGVNHKTRVIQELSERIKKKFEMLSSNSCTAALWSLDNLSWFHLLNKICYNLEQNGYMTSNCILQLWLRCAYLSIFAAAGRGQYSKALRLYLEQITVLEIQYGALLKTFKVVGLHTVRYNKQEWSGVWTHLSIEQRLMKAAKSSEGFSVRRMRTHESAHKLWTVTLNQMALINESVDEAIADLSNKEQQQKSLVLITQISTNLLYRKILQRLPSCCVGLKIQLISTNLKTRLKCYRTQWVSYHRKRRIMSTQKIAFHLVLPSRKSWMARALSISFELKAKSET